MPDSSQSAVVPTGPLAGIRVVDLTINVLGPVCTQILGDMGADVIKVEAPEGDYVRYVGPGRSEGMSVFFLNLNRNKRSVVLDLKQPDARAALMKLIEAADVLVHSMRLGAADRLGLSHKAVSAVNPRIVYASATGYRQDSARRDWPAFDDVIQGVSGIAAMNGHATGAALFSYGDLRQILRICAGFIDRHGLVCPRTNEQGPGGSSCDDGYHGWL
jgi:crotonobetainyl-CoA:carnitine CoA-transferase CaiB-like acyl-CoA transferase